MSTSQRHKAKKKSKLYQSKVDKLIQPTTPRTKHKPDFGLLYKQTQSSPRKPKAKTESPQSSECTTENGTNEKLGTSLQKPTLNQNSKCPRQAKHHRLQNGEEINGGKGARNQLKEPYDRREKLEMLMDREGWRTTADESVEKGMENVLLIPNR
ncbi:hypothetical protein Gotur_015420 [Gossypium turneri]